MKTSEELRLQKVLDSLQKAGFTETETDLIEEYVLENEDRKILESIPKHDFQRLGYRERAEICDAVSGMISKGYVTLGERIAEALTFMGGLSVICIIRVDQVKNARLTDRNGFDIRLIAEVSEIANPSRGAYYASFNNVQINRFLDEKKGREEEIKKSWERMTEGKVKLYLGTFYLWMKYGNKKAPSGDDVRILKACEAFVIAQTPTLFASGISLSSLEDFLRKTSRQASILDKFLKKDSCQVPEDLKKEIEKCKQNYNSNELFYCLVRCACLNYKISSVMENFMRLAVFAGLEEVCKALCNGHVLNNGYILKGAEDVIGDLDRIFGADSDELLRCGIKGGNQYILERQLKKNPEGYVSSMLHGTTCQSGDLMLKILMEKRPDLFADICVNRQEVKHAMLLNEILENASISFGGNPLTEVQKEQVRKYLEGYAPIDSLYSIQGLLVHNNYGIRAALEKYEKLYGIDDFYKRCTVYAIFVGSNYDIYHMLCKNYTVKRELIKRYFSWCEEEKLAFSYQLTAWTGARDYAYSDNIKKEMDDYGASVFRECLIRHPEETIAAFAESGASGRCLAVHLYGREGEAYKKELFSYAKDSSKQVKAAFINAVGEHKEWKEDIFLLLETGKAAERETAARVLLVWGAGSERERIQEVLGKEKSEKIAACLREILGFEKETDTPQEETDLISELHKGGKKRTLAWAYETPFSAVHKLDGEEAAEDYMQAVLLCYSSMTVPGISDKVHLLTEALKQEELARYMNELFDKWMEKGAEAKKKWVLYAASIHGGAEIIERLQKQISEWPLQARSAIAAEAVKALSLSSQPTALMIVDGISRKFKFKQVKAAAGEALEFAAKQLGLTKEELSDKIVPDLGFDEHMERSFDYGERKFTVTITPALEIEVRDESGKKLKNMPAPGKRDDEAKAAAAYSEFKQMKKQMKTTAANQKTRLDLALSTERKWTGKAWKDLFVKNPVMHQFAISLIWGIYDENQLKETFRYMEDGSFNTMDEEETELKDNDSIGLVHPIELSEEEIEAWKEQLEDYEITQSIDQLNRPVYRIEEEEKEKKMLERFGGCILPSISLSSKLLGMGWYRGSVQDGGGYYCFYREDKTLNMGVELNFSGSFVGYDEGEATVYDAVFYAAGTVQRGSYIYDQARLEEAFLLKDIPVRYFSEIVYQLTKATASSEEKNVDWRKEAYPKQK